MSQKIIPVIGTRPEAIKLAPVIKELERHPKEFKVVAVTTAQHRQMLDQVLKLFKIISSYDLDIMEKSYFILTDSGGIQEAAPSLGKPVLVLCQVTERPEAVEAGTVRVVGLDKDKIVRETQKLLDDETLYEKMSKAANPYGDGKASKRIVEILGKSL